LIVTLEEGTLINDVIPIRNMGLGNEVQAFKQKGVKQALCAHGLLGYNNAICNTASTFQTSVVHWYAKMFAEVYFLDIGQLELQKGLDRI
jgi:hypothetical protein